MKYSKYLFCVVCSIWFYAGYLLAADVPFIEGQTFVSKGISYTIINNLVATKVAGTNIKDKDYQNTVDSKKATVLEEGDTYNDNLPQAVVEPDTVVERKGNLEIRYKSTDSVSLSTNTQNYGTAQGSGLAVVRNGLTRGLGVVLGNINTKIRQNHDPETIATKYGIDLMGYASGPRLAFFKVSGNIENLVKTWASLKEDEGVERASIEILEHLSKAQ